MAIINGISYRRKCIPVHLECICKALAQSGQQQITAKKETFWVDFDALVNLPKPNEIITRCFVCLNIDVNILKCSFFVF